MSEVAEYEDKKDVAPSETAFVKHWLSKISRAEAYWNDDYDRMRENIEFAAGWQWDGQKKLNSEDYVNNVTLGMIRQKVATLYARNPVAEAKRRERLDFVLWDGDSQSILEGMMRVQQGRMMGYPDMEAEALIADFIHGKQMQKLVDRICKTIELVYQYQVDATRPEFKEQMKQLVTRTVTTGVGYLRPVLVRPEMPTTPSSVESPHTIRDRLEMYEGLIDKMEKDSVESHEADVETLKSLAMSMGFSAQTGDEYELEEHIEFDFPKSTSIIPDPGFRSLKEFVAARWIAICYDLPLDEAKAMFDGADIKPTLNILNPPSKEQEVPAPGVYDSNRPSEFTEPPRVKVYEVLDYKTKTHFYVCNGYHCYLRPPEPLFPCINGFWPVFALTFNDVESDPETKTTPFPPSDVDLIRHPQKEWNRTRDALRDQRNANAPTYLTRKSVLTEEDKQRLRNREPNGVVELEGVPLDMPLEKAVIVMQTAAIDPAVYDTAPLAEDISRGAGVQQANIGPAQPNVTATVGSIAEESRLTVSSSNIDDLDGFLSRVASACKDLMLGFGGFSEQTVKRIAGPGAVWPTENRSEYVNGIMMTVKAGSSGRPNKALGISNFERVAPTLIQSGANPFGVIEEGVKRLDDQLDVSKFLPNMPMTPGPAQQQPAPPQQMLPSGQPVQQP